MSERLTVRNQSVEKTIQIIEAMAESTGPMRLADISEKVRFPACTVLRMINSLMSLGYVKQRSDNARYYLTLKFCRIGELIKSQYNIRSIVRPYLVELSQMCQESSCLAIEEDMRAIYIDVVDGPDKLLKTLQRIGRSAPLHSTGVGKLLLLNHDYNRIHSLFSQTELPSLTNKTITKIDQLLEELKKIADQGYALDDEECEIGARCVAAPIRDYTGKIIACMSVSGPVSRITMNRVEEIKDTIINLANKVSYEFGYRNS